MFISELGGEEMPMWCPPTPPQDDNDIYMDDSLHFFYEAHTMPEQSLPPIYVPKAHKKPKLETVTTRKQKQRKEEQPRVPRSLFDKPKEVVNKQRKEAKMQRLRHIQVPKMLAGRTPLGQHQQAPQQAIVTKPEPDPNYPEWLVHEEWALLEAVQHIQKLSPDVLVDNPAQTLNWDFVADYVSVVGRIFRAPKQCRSHYDNVVLPREDGRIMYNIKQKKSPKSIYKTKNTRPLRTEQLYSQDGLKNFSQLFNIRFGSMMDIGAKRPTAMHQTIVNPTAKPTKHATILADNGISYDNPMLPCQLAARRAERIILDKKKQQAQQQAQAASVNAAQDQAVVQRTAQAGLVATGVTPTIQATQLPSIVSVTSNTLPGQVPKVAVGTGLTAVSIARTLGATGNIIVNTGLQSGPFAAINKRMQAAALPSTVAVSGNITSAIRGQRTAVPGSAAITLQEVGSLAVTSTTVAVAAQAARSAIQSTVASSSLSAGLMANQKLALSPNLQSQLARGASLTPHQINILRSQPSIVRAQAAGGAQQFRAQKLLTTNEHIRAQQLGKHPQKVITQQFLVPVRGGQSILQSGKPGLLRTTIQSEQVQALKMRTQIQTSAGKQLQTAQIIQGQVTPVGQTAASTSQTPVALVKSVSASAAGTVPVTIPVSGISVGQQRTVVASRAATQIHPHTMLLQQRKTGGQQKVSGLNTGKTGQIPLLIPQNTKLLTSNQILHQIGVVNRPAGAIQQIITHSSQPTIITQVSQTGGQPITQMVAKVSLTSGGQTITPGTPITVTHVSSAAQGMGLNIAGKSTVKTATITSLDGGTNTIQVNSVHPGQKNLSGLTQSLVTLSTAPSSATTTQVQTAITVPASLVASASALRASAAIPVTTAQISLVSAPSSVQSISTIATGQVQPNPSPVSVDVTSTNQVIAQNVPAPAAMATVVTQTSQAESAQQGAAGLKASPYTMRTRNAKH